MKDVWEIPYDMRTERWTDPGVFWDTESHQEYVDVQYLTAKISVNNAKIVEVEYKKLTSKANTLYYYFFYMPGSSLNRKNYYPIEPSLDKLLFNKATFEQDVDLLLFSCRNIISPNVIDSISIPKINWNNANTSSMLNVVLLDEDYKLVGSISRLHSQTDIKIDSILAQNMRNGYIGLFISSTTTDDSATYFLGKDPNTGNGEIEFVVNDSDLITTTGSVYTDFRGFDGNRIVEFVSNTEDARGKFGNGVAIVAPHSVYATKFSVEFIGPSGLENGRWAGVYSDINDGLNNGVYDSLIPSAYIRVLSNGRVSPDGIIDNGSVALEVIPISGRIQTVFWTGLPTEEPFGWDWGSGMTESVYNTVSNISSSNSYPIYATVELLDFFGNLSTITVYTNLRTNYVVQPVSASLPISKSPDKYTYDVGDEITLTATPVGFEALASDSYSWTVSPNNFTVITGNATTSVIKLTCVSSGVSGGSTIEVRCTVPDKNTTKLYSGKTSFILNAHAGSSSGGGGTGGDSGDSSENIPNTQIPKDVELEPGYCFNNVNSTNFRPSVFGLEDKFSNGWDSKYIENYRIVIYLVEFGNPDSLDDRRKALYLAGGNKPYAYLILNRETGTYDYFPSATRASTSGIAPGKYSFTKNLTFLEGKIVVDNDTWVDWIKN